MKKIATTSLLAFIFVVFAFGKNPFPTDLPEWETLEATMFVSPGLCTDVMLLDTTYDYDFVGGNWQFVTKNIFEYNPAGQLLNEYQYKWLAASGTWENDKWYTYTYNAAGELALRYRFDWRPSLGIWENEYQYTNSYDASHRRSLSIRKDWVGNAWVNAVNYTYTYQGTTDLLTERLQQDWVANAWQNATRYTYTNNAQGLRTENAIYLWNLNAWKLDSRYQYSYNASKCLTIRTYQLWNGLAWVLDSKNEYSYNAQNYETQWIKSNWSGTSYSQIAKETSVYFLQNAAPTNTNLSNSTIQSNVPIGSLVGSFTTTDPDDNAFFYTFVDGIGGQDNGLFSINGNQLLTNSNFANGNASQYFVLVQISDGSGGICQQNFVITVQYPVPISINPAGPFCQDAGIQLFTASPAGGVWGGVANAQGQLNPANLTPGTHNVTYTFTSPSGQTGTAAASITILANPVVSISATAPICTSAPIQTLTGSPVGGTWGGSANSQGQINPAVLSLGNHQVAYSFTNASGCSGTATATIVINPNPVVTLPAAGPFCGNAGVQTLVAMPTGGVWSGAANQLGQMNPAVLGTGSHTVTYTFTDASGCSNSSSQNIVVNGLPTAEISGSGTVCSGSGDVVPMSINATGAGSFTANFTINGNPQPPLSLTSNSFILNATTSGTYLLTSVTDSNGCTNSGSGQGTVMAVNAPLVLNVMEVCDPTGSTYRTSFEIIGGDPASYTVTGVGGSINANSPYFFISDPIPTGSGYSLTVSDGNNCAPQLVSQAAVSCSCVSEAGVMSQTLVSACGNGPVQVGAVSGQTLDPNDGLVYALHTGAGGVLGNILATNTEPVFNFIAPMQYGFTYHVSAVVGNQTADGVDLNDPCLAVSVGTPVVFQPLPTGNLDAPPYTCEGEAAVLVFCLTGNGPFDVTYSDGSASFTLNNIYDGYQLTLNPTVNTTYSLVNIADNSTPNCVSTLGDSVTVNVNPIFATAQTMDICQGESAALAGDLQTLSDTYIDIFSSSNGCDSTVTTQLFVHPLDTTYHSATSCLPSQTGVFTTLLTNQFGCDSLVIETIMFSQSDTTLLQSTSCDLQQVGVFTSNFINQNGCDSVVVQTVLLAQTDTTFLTSQTCDPQQVGVFTSIFTNQNGCDSVVVSTTSLYATPAHLSVAVLSDFNGFGVSCNGSSDGSVQASVASGGTAPFSYLWENGAQSSILAGLLAGEQKVTVTDFYGCETTASVSVTEPLSVGLVSFVEEINCDQTGGFIEVEGTGGVGQYRYSLNDGDWQIDGHFDVASTGAYKLAVKDANGCETSEVVTVGGTALFMIDLGPDLEIAEGDKVKVEVGLVGISLADIETLTWSPPTGLLGCVGCVSQTLQPSQTTTYQVLVTSQNGCTASSNLTVTVNKKGEEHPDDLFYVPTAFSPNDDGVNDFFKVFLGPKAEAVESLVVFDRTGELVFETKETNLYKLSWDGNFRFMPMNPGTFVWSVAVRLKDGTIVNRRGDVTLVR